MKNDKKEILEKFKKKNNNNNIYTTKRKQDTVINNIQLNLKCSPERIYYKKNCNCNIIHPSSSNSIIVENNKDDISTHKAKIFKKKISKNSVSKNKYLYKSNNMNISNSKINEICHKKLYLKNNTNNDIISNNSNKLENRSYYEPNSLNMSNTQYFRKTNNKIQTSKENDKNSQNLFLQRNNSGNSCFNIKYSVESENVNNYKNNHNAKYEIETKNIKLGHLKNKKYYYGSDYKRTNNGSRLTQVHSPLNSSGNFFENSNSTYSKDDNLYESQSIGNYYIKW